MSDGWISGSFSVSVDMSANAAAGINIVASAFSNQMDVVKTGINNCLTKDGQNTPTANLPMGGFRHTSAGAATATDQYIRVKEYIKMSPIYMVDQNTGSSLSISCSVTPFISAGELAAGTRVWIKNAARPKPSASANDVIVNLCGITATVSAYDGSKLWPGAFASSGVHELLYDGSSWRLMNPSYIRITAGLVPSAIDGSSVAVTLSATATVTCEFWRDGGTIHALIGNDPSQTYRQLSFQTSTGRGLRLTGVPDFAQVTRKIGNTMLICDNSIETLADVSAGGSVIRYWAIDGTVFSSAALLPNAHLSYPVR